MMRVETETEKIVAVLHEGVEDSQPPQRWGCDELRREGFSKPVLVMGGGRFPARLPVLESSARSATAAPIHHLPKPRPSATFAAL